MATRRIPIISDSNDYDVKGFIDVVIDQPELDVDTRTSVLRTIIKSMHFDIVPKGDVCP